MRPTPSTEQSILQKVVDLGSALQIIVNNDDDALDKLCILYIKSKSTRFIQRNKSMISTTKLKKMYTNL